MMSFVKKVEMMSKAELRAELTATRQIIDDIYDLTKEPQKNPTAVTDKAKRNILNQIARYCYRSMPK